MQQLSVQQLNIRYLCMQQLSVQQLGLRILVYRCSPAPQKVRRSTFSYGNLLVEVSYEIK
ncbi:hypothetical protein D3C77_281920 [compost metagenome]